MAMKQKSKEATAVNQQRETEREEQAGTATDAYGGVAFDEVSAARGSLGRFSGSQVMPLIKDFLRAGTAAASAGTA